MHQLFTQKFVMQKFAGTKVNGPTGRNP